MRNCLASYLLYFHASLCARKNKSQGKENVTLKLGRAPRQNGPWDAQKKKLEYVVGTESTYICAESIYNQNGLRN